MSTPKTVDEWLVEIDAGLEYRKIFAREASWRKIELNYLNDPQSDTAIGPNLVYSMGDSLVSSLMVPDPEFLVAPTRSNGVDKAPIVEAIDNTLTTEMNLKRYIDMSTLHGFLYGSLILKIGYDSEFGWAPFYDIGQGNNLGMTTTQFDTKTGYRIETPDTRPGWPWVRPVLPHTFIVPWGTVFLEDAPWACHEVIRHIDYIKKDPKYRNTKGLQGQLSMKDWMESHLTVGKDKQRARLSNMAEFHVEPEYVKMYEIRNRMTGEIIVITRDHDKFLRKAPDAIQLACGMPFVHGTMSQHPRSFWSTPPAYYLGQIQATQFDISLQAEKERRISVLKFLYRKGALSESALARMLSGDVGAAEAVDNQYPLNDVIATMPKGNSYDHIVYADNNRRDARDAIGFSRNQLGEFDSSSRRTAREATFVAQGSGLRTSKRGQVVSNMYVDTMRKVNGLVFNFWTIPREIMVDSAWVDYVGSDLAGHYQYDVSLSTKRVLSKAERKIEALSLLPMLMQIPGINVQAVFQDLINASSDPSFESMLGQVAKGGQGQGQQQQGSQQQLPTIPGTGRA